MIENISGPVGEYFSFLSDDAGVTDCETIEQIHEDHDDQEHEGEEVDVGQRCETALQVDWNVTKMWKMKKYYFNTSFYTL